MNNLQPVLNAYQQSQQHGLTSFLATVVSTKGSTYRRSGARMLICRNEMVGMVSGGCLEHDILCHLQQREFNAEPFVITYDTTTTEDIIWGFGLGCDGVVQILVECLDHNPILNFIQSCFDRQAPGIIATVFQVKEESQVSVGTRLMLHSDGSILSHLKDTELHRTVLNNAHTALRHQKSTHCCYPLASGQVEVFIEVIQPPTHLILFGAGRDALPVAQFAKALGWHVTLIDCRSLETTEHRFPMVDQIILSRREIVSQQVTISNHSIAIVMTHNYLDDLEILEMLLSSPASYIGVLGSRKRTERLLQSLESAKVSQNRLHAPIGLDIGAETPEAIAIAIIAEIQAVLAGRNAGFLKYRQAPIHQSTAFDLAYAAS